MKKDYSLFNKTQKEQNRLVLQAKYSSKASEKIVELAFENLKDNLLVVDFGCFNGKTTQTFFEKYEPKCKRIVGFDFVQNAVDEANKNLKNDKYKFFFADLEAKNFEKQLQDYLKSESKEYIDVAFFSYVLLHLTNPQKFLKLVSKYSNEETVIIIIDTDDSLKVCYPHNEILQEELALFPKIRKQLRYSNRFIGKEIPNMLMNAGFKNISDHSAKVSTIGKSIQERRDLYIDDFSYRENPQKEILSTKKIKDLKSFNKLCKRNKYLLKKIKTFFEDEKFFYLRVYLIFVAKK